MKDNGVRLISAMENIPDSPESNLMEALLEGFNQYFSEELAQKVRRGINESWRKGHCTGQRVYGYDVIDKKYVINEQEAAVVREVFIKYSQGFKIKTITQELLAQGTKKKNRRYDKSLIKTEKQSANSPRTAFYSYASSYILWSGVPGLNANLSR